MDASDEMPGNADIGIPEFGPLHAGSHTAASRLLFHKCLLAGIS